MRIKTITAPKMEDALRIIRTELGPDALILSTRKVKNGDGSPTLEITAAVPDDQSPSQQVPPPPSSSPLPLPKPVTPFPYLPKPQQAEKPTPAAPAESLIPPTTHTSLTEHGLPTALIQRIEAALPGLASAGFTGDEALEMLLSKFIKFQPQAEILLPGRAHLFLGPHGAGKTTLVARLAISARTQGRTVGLLSLDDQKIGGFEPLSIVAGILGDSAHLLTSRADLAQAAQTMGPRHILLIDTPGLNPYQPQGLTNLQRRLAELGIPATTHLVLPATLNTAEMGLFPVACHRFNPASLIFTRLDATTRYGALAATAEASGLPVGIASHSADMSVPPLTLTARWLAEAISNPPRQPWEFSS